MQVYARTPASQLALHGILAPLQRLSANLWKSIHSEHAEDACEKVLTRQRV